MIRGTSKYHSSSWRWRRRNYRPLLGWWNQFQTIIDSCCAIVCARRTCHTVSYILPGTDRQNPFDTAAVVLVLLFELWSIYDCDWCRSFTAECERQLFEGTSTAVPFLEQVVFILDRIRSMPKLCGETHGKKTNFHSHLNPVSKKTAVREDVHTGRVHGRELARQKNDFQNLSFVNSYLYY